MMVIIADALNLRVPAWEHVWLIEYDVVCCGHWGRTLLVANESPEHKDMDLMGRYFEQWRPRVHWMWGRLVGDIAKAAKTPSEWKIFIPLMRMSRRSIEGALKHNLGKASGYVKPDIPRQARQSMRSQPVKPDNQQKGTLCPAGSAKRTER